jgi:hypothetical protein
VPTFVPVLVRVPFRFSRGATRSKNNLCASKALPLSHLRLSSCRDLEISLLSTAPAAVEPQRVQQVTGTIEHLADPKYKRAVQMLFRMITPRISKSHSIIVRKGIPKDVRADYERLYGQRWEAKLTLPAGTKPHEAKLRISEFTATVETQIAAIAKRMPLCQRSGERS